MQHSWYTAICMAVHHLEPFCTLSSQCCSHGDTRHDGSTAHGAGNLTVQEGLSTAQTGAEMAAGLEDDCSVRGPAHHTLSSFLLCFGTSIE